MKLKLMLLPIIAAIIPALLFGHGWNGIDVRWQVTITLLIGILGVAIGVACFQVLNRFTRMKLQSSVPLIITCGLLSGLLTVVLGNLLGGNAWDWFKMRGDLEAYLWCIFLASITSGIIAIPFGAGLLQSVLSK